MSLSTERHNSAASNLPFWTRNAERCLEGLLPTECVLDLLVSLELGCCEAAKTGRRGSANCSRQPVHT